MGRAMRGQGSVWQRKSDGLWIGAVDVGHKDGKRQRRRVSAKSQAECVKKLEKAKQAKAAGNLTTSSMRLDAWLRYWLDDVVSTEVKPKTLADYRSKVDQYLIPALGKHRLERLTPIHVRDLHRQMLDGTLNGRKLSPSTVTHTHWVLSRALRDAMTNVGLARNVTESVRPPKAPDAQTRSLTPAEARAVLDASGNDLARWMFAFYTGARQGECLGLRWDHVDLEGGSADLAWSLQRAPYLHGCGRTKDGYGCGKRADNCPRRSIGIPPGMPHEVLDGNLVLVRPKTVRSIRVVDLVPGLIHALRGHQERDSGPNPHGLVWHRPDGRPVDGRIDYLAWQELLKQAKVEALPLHATRHTANTLMMLQGVPEAVRMQILGHSLATTNRLYAHADRTLTRAAVAAIETAIQAASGEGKASVAVPVAGPH